MIGGARMSYAIAVGIYITVYLMGGVLPLLFGESSSVIRLVILSIPVLMVMPRISQRFRDGQPLLPESFRGERGGFYLLGIGLIFFGHLLFFGSIGFAVYLSTTGATGAPIGFIAGFAVVPYLVGIVLVELDFRTWSSRQPEEPWKSQKKSVYIVVGLIAAVQLGFNLMHFRPTDRLSYDELEALALSRGYAREVQRAAERFYVAEDRIPCSDDRFVDIESLLFSANRDMREYTSINLVECGQVLVTIHKPVDGVVDAQLLLIASPGDTDAGKPLIWQCLSPNHDRIEGLTNGQCTYDASLAGTLPVPSPPSRAAIRSSGEATVQRTRNLAAASVAPEPTAITSPPIPAPPSNPGIQAHLDRLSEPPLWEICNANTTIYRYVRYNSDKYVAAVRMSHDSQAGAFRSVTSSSPDRSIGMDGYVSDRTWGRLEASMSAADFWNLESSQKQTGPDGRTVYVEACKGGSYYSISRPSGDRNLATVEQIFKQVGGLDWLEN